MVKSYEFPTCLVPILLRNLDAINLYKSITTLSWDSSYIMFGCDNKSLTINHYKSKSMIIKTANRKGWYEHRVPINPLFFHHYPQNPFMATTTGGMPYVQSQSYTILLSYIYPHTLSHSHLSACLDG